MTVETPHGLLVIVPAWNEEPRLAAVLAELAAELPEADVLVIDDGSTDATIAVARSAGVRTLELRTHRGLGAAIAAGFGYAIAHGYTICGRVDADGQHPVRELRRVLESVQSGDCEYAIGSRFLHAAETNGSPLPMRHSRRLGTSLVRFLINGITHGTVADPLSGMCAAASRALPTLAQPYEGDLPEAEAIVRMHNAGIRISEIPVTMRSRTDGQSKLTGLRLVSTLPTLALLIRLRLRNSGRPVGNGDG